MFVVVVGSPSIVSWKGIQVVAGRRCFLVASMFQAGFPDAHNPVTGGAALVIDFGLEFCADGRTHNKSQSD